MTHRSRETEAVQAGHFIDPRDGAVVPPLQMSTTYARGRTYEPAGDFVYSRYGSPTVSTVESVVADLDGGAEARLFSSGLAGFAAVLESVPTGAHVVAPRIMYHGAQSWLRRLHDRGRIELTLFGLDRPEELVEAIRPGATEDRKSVV